MRKNLPVATLSPLVLGSALRRVRLWASVGALALLAACGGTKTVEPFVPTRVVAFGDEMASVAADGRRYTVNVVSSGALDCRKNPLWIQRLTTVLAVPLTACPDTSPTDTTTNTTTTAPAAVSLTQAAPLARVADLTAQVDAFVQAGGFGEKDLVTMSVGMHEILAAYANAGTTSEADLVAGLQASGKAFGAQVNRVALQGNPVLVLTVFDLGLTPFGRAEEAATPGRAALLRRLTSAYNIAMRLEIINDGRLVGLVDTFDLINAMVRVPFAYGVTNVTDAVCTVAAPACSSETLLQSNGAPVPESTYLWSDSTHLSPAAHTQIGILAEARARNNPF